MDDDFNTPVAVAALFDLASEINRTKSARAGAAQLKALAGVLGLLQREPAGVPARRCRPATRERRRGAHRRGDRRARAPRRRTRDFAEADRIRKALADEGVVLEDGATGTVWRRA